MALVDILKKHAVSEKALAGVDVTLNLRTGDVKAVLKCCPNPEYHAVISKLAGGDLDHEELIDTALIETVIVEIEGESDKGQIREVIENPIYFELKAAIKNRAYALGVEKDTEKLSAKKP